MNAVKDKIWFLREGLFAKYVVALVGLVVFVLAVNGAMETWISYRAIKTSLNDGMSEKAEATAKRIEQSMSDLERQISWVTRASVRHASEQRRADYAQLLNQVPSVSQLSLRQRPGPRAAPAVARQTVTVGSNVDFSRDVRFTETVARGTSFAPAYFQRPAAVHVDRAVAFRIQRQRHRRRDRPALPGRFPRRRPGRQGRPTPMWPTPAGEVLAGSAKGPEVGKRSVETAAGRGPRRRRRRARWPRAPTPTAMRC